MAALKPMLDFVSVPEAVQGRRRRRRCVVKTPKNPKVKAVPLDHQNQQPCVKWVSPQFDMADARGCVRRRPHRGVLEMQKSSKRTLQLEEEGSPAHISFYPNTAPRCIIRREVEPNSTANTQNDDSNNNDNSDHPQSISPDQTVPEIISDQTVPNIIPEEGHEQDSDATTDDIDNPVEDLSALVGNLSLDDTTNVLQPEQLFPMDCSIPHPSDTCSMTDLSLKDPEYSLTKSTQTNWPEKDKEETSDFQPPSTSTPCRTGETPPPSTAPSAKHPDSNFELHLTETTEGSPSEDEQLENYETSSCSSDDLDVVLALETPQHLWRSPEVKVIDNTFS